MVESIQNRIYHRLNQLQIESTIGGINYKLQGKSKVKEGQSQRSKKVKTQLTAGFWCFTRLKRRSVHCPIRALLRRRRAGSASWELKLEAGPASWELVLKI